MCSKFSLLFELCKEKTITLNTFLAKNGLLTFRRWLLDLLHDQWEATRRRILNQTYEDTPDQICWKWTKTGRFLVKSTYEHLTSNESGRSFTNIWKAKIPYKIKKILWLMEQGAVLTKDNMIKRNWNGDPPADSVLL